MKNINGFISKKYTEEKYEEILPQVFRIGDEYVTSLSFEQEPEKNEGNNSKNISQYPLEDILDKFFVYISDFYPQFNNGEDNLCYLEFSSNDIEDIVNLRKIIGKHVYNEEVERNGEVYIVLTIAD